MSRAGAVSRRRFLGAAGAAGAGALVASTTGIAGEALTASPAAAAVDVTAEVVPFHGQHQAGIVTPAQDKMLTATFDVTAPNRDDVVDLLRQWTRAARRMTAGLPVGTDNTDQDAPPDDTGESVGLGPAALTVTFGFGTTLFERDGVDRFGLAAQRPAALADLPSFAGDEIEPARSGGDLIVQACANDPQVAFHAIRNLARIGRGDVVLRWSQSGFGRTSKTDAAQVTPRNLMGFKDGTNNLVAENADAIAQHVWVGNRDDPAWMRGGTYMVVRRIRMLLEVWDRSTLADQEATIGRVKSSGAPLGRTREHQAVDLKARSDGELVIPADAHIRLAAPATNRGVALLRRGYSFTDGIDPVTNQLDAGLFFVAFQRDPRTGFIPVQRSLATDALNEYIRHTGTGLFAVPPGVQSGGFVGETLFA
ncbi:MAG TPA: iron uptake transporter deferrochelatase/peroxidase subunit [Acidimicrobiia bacterium]|jgi:deferrochelatase/peroxidase EfeB